MLKELDLKPVYDSADCDLVRDLIVPLLTNSRDYWRGVGFFTSGWLRSACAGIVPLVNGGGRARIVTSPLMQKRDWEALQAGDIAKRDTVLHEILREHVVDLEKALSQDTLNALAWMIADGVLELRFAIPRKFDMGGDYHDKVGVFIDKFEDMVAIHGSFNDSAKGSLNGEAFSVFKSWEEGQRPYVEQHRARLTKLWQSGNAQFQVLLLPEAIRHEIIKLQTAERPYRVPAQINHVSLPEDAVHELGVKLWPYQRDAIDAWIDNDFRGIFEMATGTGKTFTALAAAADRRIAMKQVAIIILVPYLHLLEQWRQHSETFGFFPIMCSGNHDHWPSSVRSKIQDYKLGMLPSICLLAVHETASTKKFATAVQSLPLESTLLIVDEVHRLGSPHLRNALITGAGMRLGLSATPRRWYDDEGSQMLSDYFSGVCFEFSLSEAIGKFLTPYRYMPILTELTADERDEYEELSRTIAVLASRNFDNDSEAEERMKRLLLRRAQVVSVAENKLPLLLTALRRQIAGCMDAGTELRNVLIYCAPGSHKAVLSAVSGLGLRCHEFVHAVSMKHRETLIEQFAKGDVQVLVAIHCLDEGVDIPSTQTAYFLASTTNPREFIQRRGRILRKCEGKSSADVYDFIVVPNAEFAYLRRESDLGLLRREMPRFAEFASNASNEFEARAVIRNIVDSFQVLHLLDAKPWDIYRQVMESVEIKDRS
ncbi:MAG: DEAD/DEAH box helicase family protein [bacterium]